MAVCAFIKKRAAPRRAWRIIGRPQKPRLALDEDKCLALIESMVAERHAIGASIEKIIADRLGDAEAAGGILAVDDDEVERPVAAQPRQMVEHHGAAGAADDVTDE